MFSLESPHRGDANVYINCVFSLESPHRGDSNVNTQNTIFIRKKKITPDYSKSAAMGFFLRTQKVKVKVSLIRKR